MNMRWNIIKRRKERALFRISGKPFCCHGSRGFDLNFEHFFFFISLFKKCSFGSLSMCLINFVLQIYFVDLVWENQKTDCELKTITRLTRAGVKIISKLKAKPKTPELVTKTEQESKAGSKREDDPKEKRTDDTDQIKISYRNQTQRSRI